MMKLAQEDIDAIAAAVAGKLIEAFSAGALPADKALAFDRSAYKNALSSFHQGDRKSLRRFLTSRDLTPLIGKKT